MGIRTLNKCVGVPIFDTTFVLNHVFEEAFKTVSYHRFNSVKGSSSLISIYLFIYIFFCGLLVSRFHAASPHSHYLCVITTQ